jgi:glycosyltransferase involved in cell wall biosynthesis
MVSIVIPAMNEERVIGGVIAGIHAVMKEQGFVYEILVVDDGSSDSTADVAREYGARVVRHAYNMGNGAAVKTGIRNAQGQAIVMMDGDGQHAPTDIPRLLQELSTHGMVVGARTRESHTSWYRDIANWIYNFLASYICGRPILDLTSGFRAIHASLARQFLYLLPNTFSYPTTLTLATIRAGHCVKYIPIIVGKRVGQSKIKLLRDGMRFLIIILKIATLFSPIKIFLPISMAVTGLGVGWYLFTLITFGQKMPPASVILIITGIQFFLIGLVSEQIAQLRYDQSETPPPYQPASTDDPEKEDELAITYDQPAVISHKEIVK